MLFFLASFSVIPVVFSSAKPSWSFRIRPSTRWAYGKKKVELTEAPGRWSWGGRARDESGNSHAGRYTWMNSDGVTHGWMKAVFLSITSGGVAPCDHSAQASRLSNYFAAQLLFLCEDVVFRAKRFSRPSIWPCLVFSEWLFQSV